MTTLDNEIVPYIFFNTGVTAGTYQYEVQMQKGDNTWETVFNGRTWLDSAATYYTKEFYLNDILNNMRKGFSSDIYKSGEDGSGSIGVRIFDKVRVALHLSENDIRYTSEWPVFLAYHYPHLNSGMMKDFFHRSLSAGVNKYIDVYRQGSLLPRIPYKSTWRYSFLETLGFHNNMPTNLYQLQLSGGVTGDTIGLSISTKQSRIDIMPLDELFDNSECNGTDGLLSCYTSKVYTEITNSCTLSISGDAWYYDVTTDSYKMTQPLSIEAWTGDDSAKFFEIYPPELYQTTRVHYYGELDVDFDETDELCIYGGCTGENGTISITSSQFTGVKRIRLSADYKYLDDETYYYTGMLYNIKVEVVSPALKQFDCAIIDACPARYYLQWQDRYGSYQSQPFNKIDTFSEGYSYESITNYKNESKHSTVTSTPKWKINTGWLSEALYPYYESIFTNQTVSLYDTEEDRRYTCVVTDSNYTEKTFKNQGKSLFNLELNLEVNKKQTMVY